MAKTLPDWQRGVSIGGQTIDVVDIALAANKIGNVPVDIQAAGIGNVPVDIKASGIGNVPVDIKAASVGNLSVDIAAQTISDVDIDISAQSIARIVQRPSYGGTRWAREGTTVDPGQWVVIISVTGRGIIYGGYLGASGLDSPYLIPSLEIDGQVVKDFSIYLINENCCNESGMYPFYIKKYDETNDVYVCGISKGLTFDSSFKIGLEVREDASGSASFGAGVLYALA